MMRGTAANYLRLALAELERETKEHPPFAEARARLVEECNRLRDMLRRHGEDTR